MTLSHRQREIQKIASAFPEVFQMISLASFTTWQIGGACQAAFVRNPSELASVVTELENSLIPWTVLGRGSNTLAPTEGWAGVAVLLSGEFSLYTFNGSFLVAGGGAPLPSMAGAACSRGLSGLAFAVGIPGTAGGGLFMNAGAYGADLGTVTRKVTVLRSGSLGIEEIEIDGAECGFQYRKSVFQANSDIITGMILELSPDISTAGELRAEAVEILRLRREKFPLHVPNAGSVFKRPDKGPPPGKLIEDCGLKGVCIGGAAVSSVHANFIENRGNATSTDVLKLMEKVTETVKRETGIQLIKEVRVLGEFI